MINVSKTAASKISERLVEEQKAGGGLRVFEQGGGCLGFQYGMMIDENGQRASVNRTLRLGTSPSARRSRMWQKSGLAERGQNTWRSTF